MIGRVSPSKLSAICPKGNPRDWPLADALMLEDLQALGEAYIRFERQRPIDAYHEAARKLKLPGKEYHWLADLALAIFHDLYFCRAVDFYLDAKGWLQYADYRDLNRHELLDQARWSVAAQARAT